MMKKKCSSGRQKIPIEKIAKKVTYKSRFQSVVLGPTVTVPGPGPNRFGPYDAEIYANGTGLSFPY